MLARSPTPGSRRRSTTAGRRGTSRSVRRTAARRSAAMTFDVCPDNGRTRIPTAASGRRSRITRWAIMSWVVQPTHSVGWSGPSSAACRRCRRARRWQGSSGHGTRGVDLHRRHVTSACHVPCHVREMLAYGTGMVEQADEACLAPQPLTMEAAMLKCTPSPAVTRSRSRSRSPQPRSTSRSRCSATSTAGTATPTPQEAQQRHVQRQLSRCRRAVRCGSNTLAGDGTWFCDPDAQMIVHDEYHTVDSLLVV